MNLHWHIIITPNPYLILGVSLGVVHSVGLDKCIMTDIHYYSIIQGIITALKILSALPIVSPPHQLMATTDIFMASMVLPFLEHHIVGIIQYVAFPDWLLSLSNMHLSFLHVFSWPHSSFLFSAE